MTATLGCMRILVSRGLVLCGVVVLLMATLSLAGGSALAAEAVASPEAASPAAPPKATYDETQPGADDPRVKEGFAAYQAGDFKKAYTIWLPLAEAGNAEAQFRIGRLYSLGEGFKSSGELALRWYRKAAVKGHVIAKFNIGLVYFKGEIVERNYEKSYLLFQELANNGYPSSQTVVGIMLVNGLGVLEDSIEGVKWIFIGLSNGDKEAEQALMYCKQIIPEKEIKSGIKAGREWLLSHSR